MAAFTGSPTATDQYTAQSAPYTKGAAAKTKKVMPSGVYTHLAAAGAGTGEINLLKLPAGKIRVYCAGSLVNASQYAANADLHIGYRAYTGSDGVAVAEDDNAFLDNADVGGGALAADPFTLPAAGYKDFDSQDGVIIFAMIDTGNIETDDTLEVDVEYSELS